MEDYLQIYPHIPDNLPQIIQGLFMRLQVPISAPQGVLNQQLVGVPPEQEGKVSFILDNEFNFDATGLNDTEVWEQIQLCREIKNQYFVNSITDKTKEMIS